MKMLTRKQAGVIFKAYKEGKIQLEDYKVKLMYNNCTLDRFGNAPYVNPNMADSTYELIGSFEKAIACILSNDYEGANRALA